VNSIMNKCAHPECSRLKPRERYACATHWKELPLGLRMQIWSGYKNSAAEWSAADKKAQVYWTSQPKGGTQ
jgi:hypothetical protein